MAEDSFEKARKAFFGTAEPTVVEKLRLSKSVLEPDRDILRAYTASAEDAINGRTLLFIGQNSPEEKAAMNVALYALAVLKRT
jgi:hypothetical protein